VTDPNVLPLPLPDARARAAIAADLDVNLLVEAGAGSGKTTELVKRMLACSRPAPQRSNRSRPSRSRGKRLAN